MNLKIIDPLSSTDLILPLSSADHILTGVGVIKRYNFHLNFIAPSKIRVPSQATVRSTIAGPSVIGGRPMPSKLRPLARKPRSMSQGRSFSRSGMSGFSYSRNRRDGNHSVRGRRK